MCARPSTHPNRPYHAYPPLGSQALSTDTILSIALQKEKEELDDITMELELADEDDKVP